MIASISFLVLLDAWSINDCNMYLYAPKRIVCKHSTGIDLYNDKHIHVKIEYYKQTN